MLTVITRNYATKW